ncbi:MAG TPA: polyribonucleotide nucleotidyltransferase [Thermoanaerobaculia bacterium]|nr:polyribonucleotide nucleotidyltransferase [Thermoanaerobaculia bacterium]
MTYRREIPIGHDRLVIESGRLAKQADGSVTVRFGDTLVLTTACIRRDATPRPFLPLTVDYREYAFAAGRIPGGFFKREGRPSEKEIITARLTDRPLRPLFPKGYFNETQIITSVLSADGENDPDVLAINGASAALTLSNIPYYNPVGAVRVGLIEGELVMNPANSERDVSDLDLVVVGTEKAVVMVEAGANQLPENTLLDCIFAAHEELQKIIRAQQELFQEMGLEKPDWQAPEPYPSELYERVKSAVWEGQLRALHTVGKFARKAAVDEVKDGYLATLPEDDEELREQVKKIFDELEDKQLREAVIGNRRRFDGRRLDEIRALEIETGLLPRTHGSALFQRGETQALASVTLGTKRDAQIIEEYEGESLQKFMLHYNFPPYSVGEVRFLRGSSRREIGHGVLARRALMPLLPNEDDFPYTIRVVSDVLESNGSSSMATVCAGSLSLFEAGVPMLAPVAGVAMGLIKTEDEFAILTDIAGQEDHHGDMDFKVAGTREGVTALQMDIKTTGVTREIMGQALEQARHGRNFILDKMEAALGAPRGEISQYAPRLYTITIPKEKIRDVIGPGGKTIRSITEETGCQIEINDDGRVVIASPDAIAADRAVAMVERLTEVPEVGNVYTGQVRRVESYGAFVEVIPGTDGLLHVSEIAPYRVENVEDEMREGDEVTVKVIDIDPSGRIRLSRKAVIMEDPNYDPEQYAGMVMSTSRDSSDSSDSRDRRGGRGGGGGEGGGRGRGGRGPGRGGGGGRGGGRGPGRGRGPSR